MNTENLEFLQSSLKYLGFDEKLGEALQKKIAANEPSFTLDTVAAFGKDGQDKMNASIYFRKSDSNDMYFMNKYDASAKVGTEDRKQTFYINKGKGVTSKEAFNLLNGRAIFKKNQLNKNNEKFDAWMQLDFSKKDKHDNNMVHLYHTNYKYDIVKAIERHPVKELENTEDRNKLISSLEKGNVQSVTFEKEGGTEKMFLSANPAARSVNVYDGHMKPVQTVEKTQSNGQAKEAPAAGEPKTKADKKQQKNAADDLMTKNRQGKSRGAKIH